MWLSLRRIRLRLLWRGLLGVLALMGLCACSVTLSPQLVLPPAAVEQVRGAYTCGGVLEARTWQLWDEWGRMYLRRHQIGARLLQTGDAYALYDIQVYFHNLEAMAERCGRTDRLVQLADDLMPLFEAQQSLSGQPQERGWVCRGGTICNDSNRLINTEVMLVSVQGLGLMSALAAALGRAPDVEARAHPFIRLTVEASVAHLLRWNDAKARKNWRRLAEARPADLKDNSSSLFFTDKQLWMIAVYANLAGIYAKQPILAGALTPGQRNALRGAMHDALIFFGSRISLIPQQYLTGVLGADIDRGYWGSYVDNRYAGYQGKARPAVCATHTDGTLKVNLQIDASDVPLVTGLGWDFSHARRLVYVLDALQRNRNAVQTIFALSVQELLPPELERAFAAQLIATVWNGDAKRPLFTNYWSGANGWYRVAYDNGSGYCNPGYPPYGLSDSFVTGGYATWGRHYPMVREIARSLYRLSQSSKQADRDFVYKYYGGLLAATADKRLLTQLMFWPTLIE